MSSRYGHHAQSPLRGMGRGINSLALRSHQKSRISGTSTSNVNTPIQSSAHGNGNNHINSLVSPMGGQAVTPTTGTTGFPNTGASSVSGNLTSRRHHHHQSDRDLLNDLPRSGSSRRGHGRSGVQNAQDALNNANGNIMIASEAMNNDYDGTHGNSNHGPNGRGEINLSNLRQITNGLGRSSAERGTSNGRRGSSSNRRGGTNRNSNNNNSESIYSVSVSQSQSQSHSRGSKSKLNNLVNDPDRTNVISDNIKSNSINVNDSNNSDYNGLIKRSNLDRDLDNESTGTGHGYNNLVRSDRDYNRIDTDSGSEGSIGGSSYYSHINIGGNSNYINSMGSESNAVINTMNQNYIGTSSITSSTSNTVTGNLNNNLNNIPVVNKWLNLKKVHTIAYPKAHGHQELPQVFGVRYAMNNRRQMCVGGKSNVPVAVCYADGALRIWQNQGSDNGNLNSPNKSTIDNSTISTNYGTHTPISNSNTPSKESNSNVNNYSNSNWSRLTIPHSFDEPDPEEAAALARGISISKPYLSEPRDPITSLCWLDGFGQSLIYVSGPNVNVATGIRDSLGGNNNNSTGGHHSEYNGMSMGKPLSITQLSHNHGSMYVCDVAYPGDYSSSTTTATKFLIAGTERKTVIYDSNTLQEICCLKKNLYRADSFAHSNRISSAKFFPGTDGNIYCSSSWDNSVSIWDCRSQRRIKYIDSDEPLSLVGSGPECIDVSNNSQVIAVSNYRTKNSVQLYDFGTCSLIESCNFNTSNNNGTNNNSSINSQGSGNTSINSSPAKKDKFIPYTCRFVGKEGKQLMVGGKYVNAERQGSIFVLNTAHRGDTGIVFETHCEGSAVWTMDTWDGEYIAGHSDGSLGVWR